MPYQHFHSDAPQIEVKVKRGNYGKHRTCLQKFDVNYLLRTSLLEQKTKAGSKKQELTIAKKSTH